MTQNLPSSLAAKATSASVYQRCLLQYSYLGFRFARFKCFPWLTLAIAVCKLPFASGVERTHVQLRYLSAIARINFVNVYGLINELLW
jgi:hypothetical protein